MQFTRKLHRQEIKRLSYDIRVAYAKWWYQDQLGGQFDLNWAVIDCYFRSGFRIEDTATVLNTTTDEIKFSIDCIIQNAQ